MKLRRLVVACAAATLGVLALAGNGSAALPPFTQCVGSPEMLVNTTAAEREISVFFDVAPGCAATRVTLAAYSKAAPGYVFPQNLAATATGSFVPGTRYVLSVVLPPCGFDQIDLLENLTPSDLPDPLTLENSTTFDHYIRVGTFRGFFSDVPCEGQGPCKEYVNPHGQTIPPAGQTPPGTNPRSGQNPDGFYQVGNPGGGAVNVIDLGSGMVFGPYPGGTAIKYTEA